MINLQPWAFLRSKPSFVKTPSCYIKAAFSYFIYQASLPKVWSPRKKQGTGEVWLGYSVHGHSGGPLGGFQNA